MVFKDKLLLRLFEIGVNKELQQKNNKRDLESKSQKCRDLLKKQNVDTQKETACERRSVRGRKGRIQEQK